MDYFELQKEDMYESAKDSIINLIKQTKVMCENAVIRNGIDYKKQYLHDLIQVKIL